MATHRDELRRGSRPSLRRCPSRGVIKRDDVTVESVTSFGDIDTYWTFSDNVDSFVNAPTSTLQVSEDGESWIDAAGILPDGDRSLDVVFGEAVSAGWFWRVNGQAPIVFAGGGRLLSGQTGDVT